MLPGDFWSNESRELLAVLRPAVEQLAVMGVNAATAKLFGAGLAFDNTLAHAAAAHWARQYTDELLERLGATSEKVVGEIVASWAETPGATNADLVSRLAPHFENNIARADLIAVTETTRAFAAGENAAYQQAGIGRMLYQPPAHPGCRCWSRAVRKSNLWLIVWQTNRDDSVCRRTFETPWGLMEGCRAMQTVVLSEGEHAGRKISDVG